MKENTNITFTPFRQVPEWDDNAEFSITGAQLRSIQRLFEAYTPFTKALEPVFLSGLDSGKITIRYEDLQGNAMNKSDIDAMLERHAQEMAASIQS